MTLEEGVHQMTGKNAEQWGITERGLLKPGFAADLCLFDLERVACQDVSYVQDVPGDESRYYRGAIGFNKVFVNGAMVLSEDSYTDAQGFGQVV